MGPALREADRLRDLLDRGSTAEFASSDFTKDITEIDVTYPDELPEI